MLFLGGAAPGLFPSFALPPMPTFPFLGGGAGAFGVLDANATAPVDIDTNVTAPIIDDADEAVDAIDAALKMVTSDAP